MLLFFGSRGLVDTSGATFTTLPTFRSATPGRSGGAPRGLDPAALDALAGMDGLGGGTDYDGAPTEGDGGAGRRSRKLFSKRPW